MSKIIPLCISIILSLSALANAGQLAKSVEHKLNQQLRENSQRYGIASQSVIILKDNKVIYTGTHGHANLELAVPIRPDHKYPVYSIAKLFASVLMMQLVEQGEVDLDKSIRDYLPQLPEHWQPVTVRHCLNHSSGLPDYFSMEVVRSGFLPNKIAVFESLTDQKFQFKTGSNNRYNQTNYLIVAAIIELKTKKLYHEVIEEVIIGPLALKNTGFASAKTPVPNIVSSYKGDNGIRRKGLLVDWPTYTYVHSALHSTADDLVRFMNALTQGKFVTIDSLAKMWQPIKLNNGTRGQYATGWVFSDNGAYTRVGHGGGNVVKLGHYFKSTPDIDNYSIIYLTNGNNRSVWTDVLTGSLMALIDPRKFPLEAARQGLYDHLLGGATPDELDQYIAGLAKNDAVRARGLERFINWNAYAVQYASGLEAGLAIFELNTRQFPKSALAWSELAEAWLAKGNKTKAIEFYQKTLSIDPEWANAKRQLNRLIE